MPGCPTGPEPFTALLDRLAAGDQAAVDRLIDRSVDRLHRLAHAMLAEYPRLRRWYETGDVAQAAALRLVRALRAVHPASGKDFMNLAALQIRRELTDLARHELGPGGAGAHHHTRPATRPDEPHPVPEAAHPGPGPATQAWWRDLLRYVEEGLPAEEREVFDLLHVQGLGQDEAATLLNVSVPTVRRRWRAVRLRLHQVGIREGP